MWGKDRKICPVGHCQVSRGLPSVARLIQKTYFSTYPYIHDRFFFLHTFYFWTLISNNAVTLIADVCHIVMIFTDVITSGDINLNDGVRDVL